MINTGLPIVSTKATTVCKPPTETNSKLNESNGSRSSITFGNVSQGSFFISNAQDNNDSPFIPLHTALENVFTNNNNAIFMVSIIHNANSEFYFMYLILMLETLLACRI